MGAVIYNLHLRNLEETEQFLEDLPAEIEVELLELYRIGGEKIVERASMRAPKKTGFMASMIGSTPIEHGVTIMGGADYTSFQEFGTERIMAKFFITDSIDEIMPEIDDEAEAIIQRYLDEASDDINNIPFEVSDFGVL